MYYLETKNLSHQFSASDQILHDINLTVERGSIYGFLGPNGAGKTTTLKLILGLLKIQKGSILVFEKPFEKNRIEILENVGSLIENPSLYGHLTAFENLKILQTIYQCSENRIKEVLDLVGLHNTGNKKASQFSLGMKQRLSIGMALIHQPKLLILDEPTNGLDPNGMYEIRELLINLNRNHGITILISSHLLAEIEKLVTHIGIIHKGKMMFEGTLEALRNKQQHTISTTIDTNNNEKAIEIIRENNFTAQKVENKISTPFVSKNTTSNLIQMMVQNDIHVYEVSTIKNDLESIFMNLINN